MSDLFKDVKSQVKNALKRAPPPPPPKPSSLSRPAQSSTSSRPIPTPPNSKRGISVPWNFDPADFALYEPAIKSGKISWCSNWEMWKPNGLPQALTYIPQIRTAEHANEIGSYLSGYYNTTEDGHGLKGFMGFNEPDIDSQANMGVDQAAELWKAHVLPTKARLSSSSHPGKGWKLGSPAISNAPQGIAWLEEFVARLGGLEASGIDVVVIHYYSPNVEHFKQYVRDVHERFGRRPVWVTEFSCTNWDPNNQPCEEHVVAFMKEALAFLDGEDWVERYAWFGSMREVDDGVGRKNGLQSGGDGLSEAGRIYTTF